MNKWKFSAAAAAVLLVGGLSLTPAQAADLGGDCCADLEERVAELEATTVRKGNRKVSLKISGWISQHLMWWDDGDLSDTYILDQGGTLASNTTFSGSAKIDSDWSAGFQLQLEWFTSQSTAVSQTASVAGAGGGPLTLFWWLKSDQLGKISLGKVSQASDNAALLPDVSGSNLITANWVIFDGLGFFVRPTGGPGGFAGLETAIWGQFAFCDQIGAGSAADCNGVPRQAIRYDSPTYGGFSMSSSWGPDDFWDVAARYRGTLGDYNVAIEGAFSQVDGLQLLTGASVDSDYFQIGGSIKHMPTGLFIYGAYGLEDNDTVFAANFAGETTLPDGSHFYLKGGVQKKWWQLGNTTIWGEYAEHEDMAQAGFTTASPGDGICTGLGTVAGTTIAAACGGGPLTITDSTFTRWGLGIQQDIDAAAMALYIKYRHHEIDVDFANAGGAVVQGFEDIDMVMGGGIIHF